MHEQMGPRLSDLTETKCFPGVVCLSTEEICNKHEIKRGCYTAYREKQVRFFRKYESALSASPRLDWM